jgi:hypothetical protein
MRHGRFEESFVISPSLDELFVELSEVICWALANIDPTTATTIRTFFLRILLNEFDQLRPDRQGLVIQLLDGR